MPASRARLGHVALDRDDARGKRRLGRIARQRVDAGALGGQPANDEAADGAGAAGDENVHGISFEGVDSTILLFHEVPR